MHNKECLPKGWYLLKAKPRQELTAQKNLKTQGFNVYCPYIKTLDRSKIKEIVLFPGYLFLYLDLQDLDRYHKVRSTRGVNEIVYFNKVTRQLYKNSHLVKFQEQNINEILPKPIPKGHDVIKDIKKIVQTINYKTEGLILNNQFSRGEKVIMQHPLYKDLEMTFVSDLGSERGFILVKYIKQQRNLTGSIACNVIHQKK